jgi:hypothetical protein
MDAHTECGILTNVSVNAYNHFAPMPTAIVYYHWIIVGGIHGEIVPGAWIVRGGIVCRRRRLVIREIR